MEDKVVEYFGQKFGKKPEFLVRCPGRVNLIGEHIDYSGYGVMPMAVQQSVFAAVAVNAQSNTLNLYNVDAKRYSDYTHVLDGFQIDKSSPQWFHYFLCGYRGMLEHLEGTRVDGQVKPVGMDVVLGGNLPPSSGLSSSSALVCCAAVCTLRALIGGDFGKVDRTTVAEICAKCERYIGTEGGGMDQAICLLAESGKAKSIQFNPLKARNIDLPHGACFVVSNSCVPMNKAATSHFNQRVVECRLATQVIAKKSNLDWTAIRTLGKLQEKLGKSLTEMVDLVKKHLHAEPYSRTEICELLGATEEEMVEKSLNQNTLHMKEFKLQQRALHVYEEAGRVYHFAAVCGDGDTMGSGKDGVNALRALGTLMDASHVSCRDLYECSCPELDELQKLAKTGGALGSRLTGAGWGGCVVSLVHESAAAEFVEYLRSNFYKKTPEREAAVQTALFISPPADGAEVKVF